MTYQYVKVYELQKESIFYTPFNIWKKTILKFNQNEYSVVCVYIYMKRLGMFPFKGPLFQGCKNETGPINTKSVMQHVIQYQVLLLAYYKADTKYCYSCAKRIQFPIRLAFPMTINKSQGQNFDKICLYLPKPLFNHGQLYVALSRVQSLGSLSIVSETN
jgi:hypothetical protein